jgi:hypothetical protein
VQTNSKFVGNVFGNDYRTDHLNSNPDLNWTQSLLYDNYVMYDSAKGDVNNIWCDNKFNQVAGGEWTPFPPTGNYWWIIDDHWDEPLPGTNGAAQHLIDDPHFVSSRIACPAHPIPS